MHSPLTSRLLLAAGALGVLGVASCGSGMSQPSAPSASSLQVLAVEEPSEDLSTDGSEDLLRILTNDDAEPWIPLPLLAAAPAKHKRPSSRGCPSGMLLVSGNYCPKVEQRCLHWLESTGRYAFYRCAEYEQPARCLSTRRPVRFCMDREEYTPRGSAVPASRQSWTMAKNVCEGLGKRVCLESEWNFACE